MIKFFKKHKLNIFSYFLCAFAMGLFTIISFSFKTYAYTIDYEQENKITSTSLFYYDAQSIKNMYDNATTNSRVIFTTQTPNAQLDLNTTEFAYFDEYDDTNFRNNLYILEDLNENNVNSINIFQTINNTTQRKLSNVIVYNILDSDEYWNLSDQSYLNNLYLFYYNNDDLTYTIDITIDIEFYDENENDYHITLKNTNSNYIEKNEIYHDGNEQMDVRLYNTRFTIQNTQNLNSNYKEYLEECWSTYNYIINIDINYTLPQNNYQPLNRLLFSKLWCSWLDIEDLRNYVDETTYQYYVNNHTYTNNQYNELLDNYNELLENYNELEEQLNNSDSLLFLQLDITKYGWLAFIDNFDCYVTDNFVGSFTFEQLKSNNYLSNNATLDLYQLSLYQNPNYSYVKFDIYFQNKYSNLDSFSSNLFEVSTKPGFNGIITIYDSENHSAIFNVTDSVSITYDDIINTNNNFGDYIYNVTFEFTSPDVSTMIYTNSFYSIGYQSGYNYGASIKENYYSPIITNLNSRITTLENNIVSLNENINILKGLNQQYQDQLSNNFGWNSLFFAFADTPFKVVSNVLGFELFGLNLFNTFIGMITVFGVVYLLKKFL